MAKKQERVLTLEDMSDELIENLGYEYFYEANPDGDARHSLWHQMMNADRERKIKLMEAQAKMAGVRIVYKSLEESLPRQTELDPT